MNAILLTSLASLSLLAAAEPAPADKDVGGKDQASPGAAAAKAEVDPKALEILKALEKAPSEHPAFRTGVQVTQIDKLLGPRNTETRWGEFTYLHGGETDPTRFSLVYEQVRQGTNSTKVADRKQYAFDGQWLTLVNHRERSMIRYQVARRGQRVQPMRIGKGPFPLPIGQEVEDVLKHFDISTDRPPRPQKVDVPDAHKHLTLLTRPPFRGEIEYRYVEVWVDPETHLPSRILAYKEGRRPGRISKVTVAAFDNLEPVDPADLGKDVFYPTRRVGWTYDVKPIQARKRQ